MSTAKEAAEFVCPRCGGHHFGTAPIKSDEPRITECHSLADGSPSSLWPDESYARRQAGLTLKMCGWRGVWTGEENHKEQTDATES